jgi:hypothetical protein
MPRKGRIKIVGKSEAWEIELRVRELRDLEIILHRQWRDGDVDPQASGEEPPAAL